MTKALEDFLEQIHRKISKLENELDRLQELRQHIGEVPGSEYDARAPEDVRRAA